MGPRREGPSSLCILAVGWSFKWEEDSSLSGWHGKKKRVHDAQASARRTASQDQAFACDHTCVIPINIGRHRCSRVTGCTQGYFAPSFTRAHRTDLLTDWLTSPPILSLPLSLSSLILSSLFPSDLAGRLPIKSWRGFMTVSTLARAEFATISRKRSESIRPPIRLARSQLLWKA